MVKIKQRRYFFYEQASVGVSILEIEKKMMIGLFLDSKYNHRIDVNTKMQVSEQLKKKF